MAIKDLTRVQQHLLLCNGSSCAGHGAAASTLALRDAISAAGLHEAVHTTRTMCNGRCDDGPIVIVQPDGIWYKHVDEATARRIVAEHVVGGCPVDTHVLYRWGADTLDTTRPGLGDD
jgi:(2Fe-2S) ferredoxin